jgi:hypothetical protein
VLIDPLNQVTGFANPFEIGFSARYEQEEPE